jgi:acylpyruvate hydrolase
VAGRPGVLLDSGQILDLSAAPGSLETSQWIPQSTISILAAGENGLEHAQSLVALVDEDIDKLQAGGAISPLQGTPLMTPVRRPGLMLVTQNIGEGVPASFIKSPNTAVGHAAQVPMHGQPQLIVNPMFAAVLGKPLYQADSAAAEEAIGAWTLVIDLAPELADPESAEDWRNYVEARQFQGSMPMGPALVTRDELSEPGELTARASINGVETWSGIICPPLRECVQRLSELSNDYAFSPGDVIAFATAVNSVSSPRQTLSAGDNYAIDAGGVMELGFELTP